MYANLPNKGFDGAIIDYETGKYLEFRHLIKMEKYRDIWMKSFTNKLDCLVQGIRDVPGTDTIDFIPHADVPFGTTVTYGRIFSTYCPQKTQKHRTWITIGGNLFICLYDVCAATSDMTTAKCRSTQSFLHQEQVSSHSI